MVKLKDISIFFQINSNCCKDSSTNEESKPCRNYPRILTQHNYIKQLYNENCTIYSTTITIGNKNIGRLSAEDQYTLMVKDIKQHIRYHSESKYIYHFELQKNGQLHAHGVEYNTYRNRFIESFSKYGRRNEHKDSFQECRNIDGYIDYISKEDVFPPISNIQKKDIAIAQLRSDTDGAEFPKKQGN